MLTGSSKKSRSKVLPGFEHISKHWDSKDNVEVAKILPGEYYVTTHHEVIATVLGSCISACIRDPDTGIGGMNHFMLPGDNGKRHDKWGVRDCLTTRYGVAAMENLINDILKQGANKSRLEIKLFGGGEVLRMGTNSVGKRNIDFVRDFIRTENFTIAAEDLGGTYPRKVNFLPKTGQVMMRRLRSLQNSVIAGQESRYASSLEKDEGAGEIDLFD